MSLVLVLKVAHVAFVPYTGPTPDSKKTPCQASNFAMFALRNH